MKTSPILLAIVTVITLTGMIATNVLLKQQYERTDWSDPFQDFERRAVSPAHHWVIRGHPDAGIRIEQRAKSQALVRPDLARFFSTRQQGDTVFVTVTSDAKENSEPRPTYYELATGLVLQIPDLQSLRVQNGWLTLHKLTPTTLAVHLLNSRLRTSELTVDGPFTLTATQQSEAILGPDHYKSLRVVVQDSSGVQLNNTQTESFTPELSPKANVQLRGQALRWLGN